MKKYSLLFIFFVFYAATYAQDFNQLVLSGQLQLDAQSYSKDSLIGASDEPEKVLSMGKVYLNMTYGGFSTGIRYENYMNPISGIDPLYAGNGIAHRFIRYTDDEIDVTAGHIYEQFGTGMILRSYEDWLLGWDNAIDGLRVKYRPVNGIELTALIGKQRLFWGLGSGIVRAGNIDVTVNDLIDDIMPKSMVLLLGGSVVSKYQKDLDNNFNLPNNVLAYSGRMSLTGNVFSVESEFTYKFNDPSRANYFTFNPGTAFLLSASYFPSGFSASLNFHRTDNMDFRSFYGETGNNLMLNYLPPLSKQHAYRLITLYPFATQLLGEVGLQAEFTYTFPRNSLIGGNYGTTVNINYSRIHNIDTTRNRIVTVFKDTVNGGEITYDDDFLTYDSPFFKIGDRLYFQDFNIEITKKWSDRFKSIFSLITIIYDKDIMENSGAPLYGKVNATAVVADLTYMLSRKNAIRLDLQHLWSKQDSSMKAPDNANGNWVMALAELTLAPSWYFTVWDEYNYGNDDPARQLHYISGSIAYVHKASRFSFGYGRQRGGILCVGGVCREVPASNGFSLSISSSF